jgi:hypothetical protein
VLAGCVGHILPNNHEAIFCCGRIDPFTPEETETLLARIPQWEAQEKSRSLQATAPELPERFRAAYQAIQRFEGLDRYRAAFIFGPVARGVVNEQSDLDVQVIVNEDTSCRRMNHPIIGGVQLNLTFLSLGQFEERTKKEIEHSGRMRALTIAESIIIFDKTRILRHMREEAQQLQPRTVSPREQQVLQSLLLHRNAMAASYLEEDPLTALLIMHVNVLNLLLSHYKQQQKWWVGPHRLLADLSTWDTKMAHLVGNFLTTNEVHTKFQWWSEILDHVLQPLGGRQPFPAQSCLCNRCQDDVALLLEEETRQ